MANIARKYDFQDGQKVYSQQMDDELNQLVNAHNDNIGRLDTAIQPEYVTANLYTKVQLQNGGQAAVHWNNITNVPNFADAAWKTAVATQAALPLTGNALGDMRVVLNDGDGKQAVYSCFATTGTLAQQWAKVGDVDWMSEEATRVTQENARVSAETSRASAETTRAAAETLRLPAESARAAEETTRAAAETLRGNAETSRLSAETARGTAETTRVNNEAGRVSAENTRVTADAGRTTAEGARASSEASRVSAETSRVTAESSRVGSETARSNAEASRASSEGARATAESARVTAESGRNTNEIARLSAENARAESETLRETAEAGRVAAEGARAYMAEYSPTHPYLVGEKAAYGGSTYQCIEPCTNVAPTDTYCWILVAQKGADGTGAGDMVKTTYDPQGRNEDIFDYLDQHELSTSVHKSSHRCSEAGEYSNAEGESTYATGDYSHTEGLSTRAMGSAAHSEGEGNIALYRNTHAEGFGNFVGYGTTFSTETAEGFNYTFADVTGLAVNDTVYLRSDTSGFRPSVITAINGLVVTLDWPVQAETMEWVIVKPDLSAQTVNANGSHVEGYGNIVFGYVSHAEGAANRIYAEFSHAEGYGNHVTGTTAHAEGDNCTASGNNSHAEGFNTTADATASHAEGYYTSASGRASHAEGNNTTAAGNRAHSEGYLSTASGDDAHAQNLGTIANGAQQTAMGKYNVADTVSALIIGNGSVAGARSNALKLLWSGALTAKSFNGQSMNNNQSTAAQAFTAATRTYVTGSKLQFAAGELAVGTRFHWEFDVTKTAAGTGASTIDVCIGTLGTTGDTARLSFAKPAGTAVIDNGKFVIDAVVRAVGASAVLAGHMTMTHNLSTTGLANVPAVNVTTVSAAFDISTATNIGVCLTTGAADAYTTQVVTAEATNL